MRLLFSEGKADYGHYVFPYAIWAFPEPGETPADLFRHGFLPSSRTLDRFYLCRQVRVDLRQFAPSSENRRILRKGQGITATLVPRAEFDYSAQRREFYLRYAEARFGKEVLTGERLDSLFHTQITSHLLVFTETESGAEVGTVTLYLEPPGLAYYYHAFYDLNYFSRNLGMYMMTWAVRHLAERGIHFVYLGSCYSLKALYKTQFAGAQFFNGVRWSQNLEELKYLLQRDQQEQSQHLLENEDYRQAFYEEDLAQLAAAAPFSVKGGPSV